MQKIIKFLTTSKIPLLLTLAVAAFFRLYKIDEYLTFLGDEGRDVLVVFHILHGNLTLLGPTASVGGFFLGPIYYYMMAPFLFLFNYNPVGPAVMVAFIGVLTVGLLYKVVQEFFGNVPAFFVSFLYAISPLAVIYSRSSWNPNPVPFFALLLMYSLYKCVTKKSKKLLIFSGILFGILLQLHYLSTFLGVVVFFYFLVLSILEKKESAARIYLFITRCLIFAAGILMGWFPFLAFEIRHGFQNIQSILKFIFSSGETGNNSKYFFIVQDVFLRIFGRLLFAYPRYEDLHLYSPQILSIWSIISVGIGVTSLFCMFILLRKKKKNDEKFPGILLFLLWIVVSILLFGFYKKPIYDYYLGILYPVPFIFLAGFISLVIDRWKQSYAVLVFVFLALVLLNYQDRPFKNPGNHQLDQVKQISDFVLSKTENKPFNFAVISAGGNSDYAYRYFFEAENRTPVTIQFPGADPDRKSITDQLLIVCESIPCHPLGYSLWEVAGFGQAEIVGEWNVSVLKVYKLKHFVAPKSACAPGFVCKS